MDEKNEGGRMMDDGYGGSSSGTCAVRPNSLGRKLD